METKLGRFLVTDHFDSTYEVLGSIPSIREMEHGGVCLQSQHTGSRKQMLMGIFGYNVNSESS